jgi:hypothetical protein
MNPDKTEKKQRGKPFEKGRSGNLSGRPKGTRNKTTLAMEALLDGEAEAITRKAIDKAKSGDMVAIRLCLERILPAVKSRPIEIDLPTVETAEDITVAHGAVIAAMAKGEITPDDAGTIASVLEAKRRAIETMELEARITEIEQREADSWGLKNLSGGWTGWGVPVKPKPR